MSSRTKKQVRNSSNSWEKQRPETSKKPQAACFPEYFALQSGSCILALAAAKSFMARLAMALAIALALVNQLALGPKTAQLMVSWGMDWKVLESCFHHVSSKLHDVVWMLFGSFVTSSTAQGGGGSFKNRKPIGEACCCGAKMAERTH